MKLWSLILLIGNFCFHWIAAVPLTHVSIDNTTLKNVSVSSDVSSVDLSGSNIEYIEENSLDGLTNVKILNLSNNKLKNLPPLIFSKLNNLEELSLADNKIFSLKKTFVGLSSLKSLNISNNSIRFLKEGDLFGLTKSTNVIIEGNPIHKLSTRAFKAPLVHPMNGKSSIGRSNVRKRRGSWVTMKFKLCMTDDIVKSVEDFRKGQEADNCEINSIAQSQKPTLRLGSRNIKGFEHGWYKIHDNYRAIDLSFNEITDITELLNDIPSSMFWISLQTNRISTIKDNAFEKTNFTQVILSNNYLNSTAFVRTLPASIEKLHLKYNSISEIPSNSFRGLKKLRLLDVDNNQIEQIEPGTFKDLENLRHISFSKNKIRELKPKLFQGLTSLKIINLSRNKIEKIQRDTFEELNSPEKLVINLDSNNINTIEEQSFSHMTISILSLSSNKIGDDSIAEGAFNGSTIEKIDLSRNLITKINGELFNGISGNHELTFSHNPIKNIDKGVAKYMGNVSKLDLSKTQLEILQNGALFGLSTERNVVVNLSWTPIKIIQGGVFDDV